MLPQIIAGLLGLGLFVAILGIRSLVLAKGRSRIDQRLIEIREGGGVLTSDVPMVYLNQTPLPFPLNMLAMIGWALPHLALSDVLQWELAMAGYRHPDGRRVFAGVTLLTSLIGAGAAILVSNILQLPQINMIMAVITGTLIGYFSTNVWMRVSVSKRQLEITLSLPDALDLMVVCVEAGQGLNAAMVHVGREMRTSAPPLSEELRMVNQEIRAGLDRSQALRNFSERTGVEDVRSLAAILIQSDRLGNSIANALRIHAQSLRIRRRQRAEEAARKTAVKLVFPLVFCIFPELLVVILAPGMIQLIRTLDGG